MKQEALKRLDNILDLIDKGNMYVIAGIATAVAIPFLLINEAWKYLARKLKGKVYDSASKEWITKEEQLKEKQKNREIPLTVENHVTPNKNDRFFFFEKRKLSIPYDKLVYVETEYNEKLHNFFSDNAEWLETWQKWHGWDFAEYSYEDIKEGMFYPQDFAVFKHGFLWHSPMSSWDTESDLFGNIHYYYEIDPDSDTPIKQQMELFMRQIYDVVDWA